jgi:endonuclease/exonuclease/phosphatase family metal-dependent hydrolase
LASIATFNVNNLFVRYRFGQRFPGDASGKSEVDDPLQGYLPIYEQGAFRLFNPLQRDLAAQAVTGDGTRLPDVLCLQEVESLIALRSFNEQHLGSAYRHALVIDSRDMRQIDVGVLSNLPILAVRSHVDERRVPADKRDPYLFSRDCLELTIDLGGDRPLHLFVNHLKSQFIDYQRADTPAKRKAARQRSDKRRLAQAERVRDVLAERFPGQAFKRELFAVLGDLNESAGSPTLTPLAEDAGLERLLERIPVESDRWTHWYRGENSVSQLDHVLLSPALSKRTTGTLPTIERRGIGYARTLADGLPGPKRTSFVRGDDDPDPTPVDFRFARFAGVTPDAYASDHCPVVLELG